MPQNNFQSIFEYIGWFESPDQATPAYDPGVGSGKCLVCAKTLFAPVLTTSLMREGSTRSYFYRTHRNCYDSASESEILNLESAIIDGMPVDDSFIPQKGIS